jgi:hypothetical protein
MEIGATRPVFIGSAMQCWKKSAPTESDFVLAFIDLIKKSART